MFVLGIHLVKIALIRLKAIGMSSAVNLMVASSENKDKMKTKLLNLECVWDVGGMSRPPKPAATAKKVAPPAVPHEFRHSGSSFGSAGYASSEDAGFLAPSDPPGVPRGGGNVSSEVEEDLKAQRSAFTRFENNSTREDKSKSAAWRGGRMRVCIVLIPKFKIEACENMGVTNMVKIVVSIFRYSYFDVSLTSHTNIQPMEPRMPRQIDVTIRVRIDTMESRIDPNLLKVICETPCIRISSDVTSTPPALEHLAKNPTDILNVIPACSSAPAKVKPSGSRSGHTGFSPLLVYDHSDYGSTVSGSTGKSPGPIFPAPSFTFPGQPPPGSVLTHKAAVYYHHQLSLQEDQGIDMTQSPGRDSPGSSSGSAGSGSRHSTASLDSGRASYHPLSTAGRSTIGSSNSPRCSLSSCSIGSDGGRIERMIHQGVPDQEIIHSWLIDLQFEEYFPPVHISRLRFADYRKRLKAEIAQLNLPDNLPEFVPGSLEEWLSLLRLEEYLPAFLEQNYQTIDDVTQLTWEDLEEFGMVKLGHQKKIMLAIKRINDIKAGKRINNDINRIYTQIRTGRGKSLESLEDPNERTHHTFTSDNTQTFYYQQPIGWRVRSYEDGDITPTNETGSLYEGGGTLPRPRGIIRPRPIAKIAAKARETFPDFEKPQFSPDKYGNQYKTIPRDLIESNKYHIQYNSPLMGKKIPPNPPKRQDSESNEQTTTVEIHHVQTSSPLPLPAYPSSDTPGTPPGAQCKLNSSQSWGAEEQELIKTLALQHRNGSDASFKSSSSTESDSLPFANENAGTIRTRAAASSVASAGGGGRQAEFSSPKPRLPPHPSPTPARQQPSARSQRTEPADVLNDIGNMLANLTDELDAMLEEEKRQQ
ncbi:hypothetical protein NQ317_002280 [Molorchus minor]|uniref:SAM domain-containing protein n=1 Tax=Molorchus minor TaxID=1323400 RepID=A0ABQ9JKY3_9CUCU|nr:hypothetical protein NQ317_002280 [Molorchus minor]